MCSSKWRLPTRDELLVACENKIKGFGSGDYWSSTTVEGNSSNAWAVHFYYGLDFWDYKNHDSYVRLVRGDNSLEWSKDIQYMTWHKAQDYIKELNGDSNEQVEITN